MSHGPGAHLKLILSAFWIAATPGCHCDLYAAVMDAKEAANPGWCEDNIDMIVGWLRKEAASRGLPFADAAGRVLVRWAVRKSRVAAPPPSDPPAAES